MAKSEYGQFLQFHLKEKSDNVIVYAYSTESVILANNSNLINDHKPLEIDIHYNLSAAHGALLVAYVIDDQPGTMSLHFILAQDFLSTLKEY